MITSNIRNLKINRTHANISALIPPPPPPPPTHEISQVMRLFQKSNNHAPIYHFTICHFTRFYIWFSTKRYFWNLYTKVRLSFDATRKDSVSSHNYENLTIDLYQQVSIRRFNAIPNLMLASKKLMRSCNYRTGFSPCWPCDTQARLQPLQVVDGGWNFSCLKSWQHPHSVQRRPSWWQITPMASTLTP